MHYHPPMGKQYRYAIMLVIGSQYFLYFGVLGIFLPYFNLYCYHLGFSGFEIGTLSALRTAATGLAPWAPVWLGWSRVATGRGQALSSKNDAPAPAALRSGRHGVVLLGGDRGSMAARSEPVSGIARCGRSARAGPHRPRGDLARVLGRPRPGGSGTAGPDHGWICSP